ncbi:MAG: hypothetical protein KDI90_05325 [Alphaproteobacteria bacterium]|nr:hypothetical protein [Alphaproteobacteria bacterium]MCB9974234.1 hypothetical protein [Rhodospirillales bacterium]
MQKPFSATKLPDRHYKQIGLIISSYSLIEHLTERIIWQLLKLDSRTGKIVTSSAKMQARIEILSTLAPVKFKNKPTVKECKESIEVIKTFYKKRNYFAHGFWFYDTKTKTTWVTLSNENKANSNFVRKEFTDKNFEGLSDGLSKCSKYLHELLTDIESGNEPLR